MNKKIIIISASVFLILLIGAVLFFLLRGGETEKTPSGDLPFGEGSNEVVSTGGIPVTTNDESQFGLTQTSSLRKLSDAPVSGATIFASGSSTIVRYIEKATGHIYEVNLTLGAKKRISNTTIPKIEEVVWGQLGNSFALRFEKDGILQTFFASITRATTTNAEGEFSELIGRYLAGNIRNFVFSPDKKKVFYTLSSATGIGGYRANANAEGSALIWQFPTREWIVSWPAPNIIALNTKASHGIAGHLLFLDTTTGRIDSALGNISGLTSLTSPDSKKIAFSESKNSQTILYIADSEEQYTSQSLVDTLPEKCAWADPDILYCAVPKAGLRGNLPDSWYMGLVSFADAIWKINTPIGSTNIISDISEETGRSVDAVSLEISPLGDELIFKDNIDGGLWALRLGP